MKQNEIIELVKSAVVTALQEQQESIKPVVEADVQQEKQQKKVKDSWGYQKKNKIFKIEQAKISKKPSKNFSDIDRIAQKYSNPSNRYWATGEATEEEQEEEQEKIEVATGVNLPSFSEVKEYIKMISKANFPVSLQLQEYICKVNQEHMKATYNRSLK